MTILHLQWCFHSTQRHNFIQSPSRQGPKHVFNGLGDVIASLDAVLLESNFDPDMLAGGPYPQSLKQRVAGPGGHISNFEAAELLLASASNRMKWACLGHLSHENNTSKLALATHRKILGDRLPIYVATRYEASGVMEIL